MKGDIDAVWVANDFSAASVISVLDKNGKQVPVSGQDASPPGLQNILLGKQVATVYKPFQLEAQAAVDLSMKLLNGEKPPAPTTAADGTPFIPQTPAVVDAKNMKVVFDDGNAKISDVCTKAVAEACQKAGLHVGPEHRTALSSVAVAMRTSAVRMATNLALVAVAKEVDVETPIIELQDVRKSFGPVEVLKGVNMTGLRRQGHRARRRQWRGKVDLDQGAVGAQPYDSGDVSFEGAPITLNSPKDASGHGIEVVYQDLSLCENLDIVQNMFLGREEVHQRMLNQPEMEKHATATLQGLSVRTMKSGTPEGLLAVRRSAPDRGDRSRRAAEGEVGHPRRADSCARCRANRTECWRSSAGSLTPGWASSSSATTSRTCSKWRTTSTCSTSAPWWPS